MKKLLAGFVLGATTALVVESLRAEPAPNPAEAWKESALRASRQFPVKALDDDPHWLRRMLSRHLREMAVIITLLLLGVGGLWAASEAFAPARPHITNIPETGTKRWAEMLVLQDAPINLRGLVPTNTSVRCTAEPNEFWACSFYEPNATKPITDVVVNPQGEVAWP